MEVVVENETEKERNLDDMLRKHDLAQFLNDGGEDMDLSSEEENSVVSRSDSLKFLLKQHDDQKEVNG